MAKVIAYSFYTLFFIVPLILTPVNYELFEFNKMLAVYALTTIITAAWIIRMIIAKKWLIKRTPFDIPLLLFLASQTLSTILSIDRRTSLLGYYSRFHGGLLSTVSYIALYYAFVSNMNRKTTLVAIRSMLSAAALVAAYGIAEHFGIDKHIWVQDVQNRVFSTLGQPNWLAAFLITIIFIPMTLKRPIAYSVGASFAYVLVAIYYLTLLYTKSRSGILGFTTGYLLFWLLQIRRFPWKHFVLITIVLILLSATDGLRWIPQVNRLYPSASPAQTETKPTTGTQLESGGSESGDIRKIVWTGAVRVWRHWPVFGSGVETFAYSYYNFRPKEHNLVSEWDFLYNKAHNEYLNFLATTGLVGLGSYLLLQAWVFTWLLKHHQPAFLSGLIALSVSNFFGFSTVPVALLFFLFPALAITHETKS